MNLLVYLCMEILHGSPDIKKLKRVPIIVEPIMVGDQVEDDQPFI